MEIVIILVLILLNGIFSMSEVALISARKSSLNNEAKHGNKAAKAALKLAVNPNNFLSTVQVGITLIGILTGLYSGNLLSDDFTPILEAWGVSPIYSYTIAQSFIVFVVTYLSIVFGELVPKRIGMSASEKIAKMMARPMNWLSAIVSPFVWLLSASTSGIINLLGIKVRESKVTEEEIMSMVREGMEDGEVQMMENEIVERAFTLGDRNLETIMTHRNDIVWIDTRMTKEEIKEIIFINPFNKYPVAKKDLNHIKGFVNLKDIFINIDSPDFNILQITNPVQYFYENMEVYRVLEKMKTNHVRYALVIDEFGSISGVVTLKDIMEALVGDMPSKDEAPEIVRRADGSYLVDGQISFYNFLSYFKSVDLYSNNDFNTLSGLILEELEHVPQTGEILLWNDFTLEIVDMDGARIDKVLVTKPAEEIN